MSCVCISIKDLWQKSNLRTFPSVLDYEEQMWTWNLSVLGHKLVFYTVTNELKFSCFFSSPSQSQGFPFKFYQTVWTWDAFYFVLSLSASSLFIRLISWFSSLPTLPGVINRLNIFTFYHFMVFCVSSEGGEATQHSIMEWQGNDEVMMAATHRWQNFEKSIWPIFNANRQGIKSCFKVCLCRVKSCILSFDASFML